MRVQEVCARSPEPRVAELSLSCGLWHEEVLCCLHGLCWRHLPLRSRGPDGGTCSLADEPGGVSRSQSDAGFIYARAEPADEHGEHVPETGHSFLPQTCFLNPAPVVPFVLRGCLPRSFDSWLNAAEALLLLGEPGGAELLDEGLRPHRSMLPHRGGFLPCSGHDNATGF